MGAHDLILEIAQGGEPLLQLVGEELNGVRPLKAF